MKFDAPVFVKVAVPVRVPGAERRKLASEVFERPAADEVVGALLDLRLDHLGARTALQLDGDGEAVRGDRDRPAAGGLVAVDHQVGRQRNVAELRVGSGLDDQPVAGERDLADRRFGRSARVDDS